MLKHRIRQLLEQAAREAQQHNLVPPADLSDISVEHPPSPEHGDYATNLPFKLARAAGSSPLVLAEAIARFMAPAPELERCFVAPPGYINFVLSPGWLQEQVNAILAQGPRYGDISLGGGTRVQIEFVSVNPTGPLHVGHGRGAVLGSSLARVLTAAGYQVETEYYINDAGSQMNAFYRSLYARYLQQWGREAQLPEDGYVGSYMVDLAREIVASVGDRYLNMPPEQAVSELGGMGMELMLAQLRRDLQTLGVEFDVWFSERSLFSGGQYDRVTALLRQGGFIQEREGALWFTSTALGESKDNVLVRSSGAPTYFASDIAYHYNKFVERGLPRVIDIWGADHQGHVSRMKAAIAALSMDPERLQVIISQMVTLKRGEEVVRISKRSGELVTLREVIDEVGADVCRFFFLTRSADSQMDFDLELAKKQSEENPVYYIQYAHTRICGILRHAAQRGIDFANGDVHLLNSEAELSLLRKMLLLPEMVETVALTLGPHHLPYYALDLATAFHGFYKQCRVVSSDLPLSQARLKLMAATGVVLAKSLSLMGVSAPEQM